MKKILLMAFVVIGTSMCANIYGTSIISTYYGTKCTDNLSKPCKGETKRLCAVTEVTIEKDSIKNIYHVIEILKDENGNVKKRKEYSTQKVPAQLKRIEELKKTQIPSISSIPNIKGTPDKIADE